VQDAVVNTSGIQICRGNMQFSQRQHGFLSCFTYTLHDKKLSYRRETARQLHMTTWAGQLTFWWSHVAVQGTEHNRIAEVVLFCDNQMLWFKKCWPRTDF